MLKRRRHSSQLCCTTVAVLMMVAGQAVAVDAVERSPGAPAHFGGTAERAVDPDGALHWPELRERVQLLFWTRQQPPLVPSDGVVGASLAGILYRAVTGGAGSGQDLVRGLPEDKDIIEESGAVQLHDAIVTP